MQEKRKSSLFPHSPLVGGVGVDVGELFGELFGYCSGFRVGLASAVLIFEGDGLVWGDFDSFAGDTSYFVPKTFDVGFVGDGGDFGSPF